MKGVNCGSQGRGGWKLKVRPEKGEKGGNVAVGTGQSETRWKVVSW